MQTSKEYWEHTAQVWKLNQERNEKLRNRVLSQSEEEVSGITQAPLNDTEK